MGLLIFKHKVYVADFADQFSKDVGQENKKNADKNRHQLQILQE